MAHEPLLKRVAGLLLSVEKINNPLIAKARAKTCEACTQFDRDKKRC